MPSNSTFALPTEPLLEAQTRDAVRGRVDPNIVTWLEDLGAQGDIERRARSLFESLRKRLGGEGPVETLEGLLSEAAESHPGGVAALAALVAVRAPGMAVIDGIREFRHLHRVGIRLRRRARGGAILGPAEASLLSELDALDEELAGVVAEGADSGGLPSPVDLGPARHPRTAFNNIVGELERRGQIGFEAMDDFVRLARLELRAAELRASALAEGINPYATRAVGVVIPVLANLDTDLREMGSFLDTLEARKAVALFQEQHPLLHDVMDPRDAEAVLRRIEAEPRLHMARRLIKGLERSPMPGRMLAYYSERLMAVGARLEKSRLRKHPIDPLEAVLLSHEFSDDMCIRIPVSQRVTTCLDAASLVGVRLEADEVVIPFDPSAARRVRAPLGLPLPPTGDEEKSGDDVEDEELQSVKDLVMDNLSNTSVLLGLLKNQKVVSKPGIVGLIAASCRTYRVLEVICQTRKLHSGFANKDVPLYVIRSPVRLPVKTVRKFIQVKYISKVELRRLARDKSGLRREIFDEVNAYLDNLT